MKKFTLLFTLLFCISSFVFAGNIIIDESGANGLRVLENTYSNLRINNDVSEIDFFQVSANDDVFTQLKIADYGFSMVEGDPKLPVLKHLIEIPEGAEIVVNIDNSHFVELNLNEYGITDYLFPAQPSIQKNQNPGDVDFVFNPSAYQNDEYSGQELVRVVNLGTMRGVRLARIEISPVLYNPVQNKIKVFNRFEVNVSFENADISTTMRNKKEQFSPYFENVYGRILNYKTSDYRELVTSNPVTYIIVSDIMFEETLQPFVEWKTKKGFKVVEAYTNNPEVGNTNTSIKAYLENFYNSPPEGYNSQSFVLFVGDVDQIPPFDGNAGGHVTDLYFCEYTGDWYPECFYGRFSANNVDELRPQIDKTLEYEQYTFPDPSFLNEVVMVAGADGTFGELHGNGQINYGTDNYFNELHGLTSHTYLQPEPYDGNYAQNIKQDISAGVGFANYTAHCGPSGWANPSFDIDDVNNLENAHKYLLMIGNCCSSVEFQITCLGEEILRAENKGAIGYIGGSNSTYWDEDYWWGVGYREEIVANPVYEADKLGVYDGLYHENGENIANWYITQGQINSAGNLAVTQAGSSGENYYWEIYHLMGDPSLMVYFSVPPLAEANYSEATFIGVPSITVNTNPYAYVAISMEGELIGTAIADESGVALVTFFAPLNQLGSADVVITGQNLEPFFGTLIITASDLAWISVTQQEVNDVAGNDNSQADYTEDFSINLTTKNYGNIGAANVVGVLSSSDEYITITDSIYSFGDFAPEEIKTVNDVYEISVAENAHDGHNAQFHILFSDGTNEWPGQFSVKLHAPILTMEAITLSDPMGDGNGKFDIGETVEISIPVKNAGSAVAYNVIGSISGNDEYITVNSSSNNYGAIAGDAQAMQSFSLTSSENTPYGYVVTFLFEINADYGVVGNGSFTLFVGQYPALIVDLDPNASSGPAMEAAMLELGLTPVYMTEFPDNLSAYSNIFVTLGIYSSNTVLTGENGDKLSGYLNQGGNLYMEGGDTWNYDMSTSVHTMFGLGSDGIDGSADLAVISGKTGTFTEGMTFAYSGENDYIDRLLAVEPAFSILENEDPNYSTAVANDAGMYRTIAASHEFGGLDDGEFPSTKLTLMEKYLNFFGLNVSQTLEAEFSVNSQMICVNDTVQFNDGTMGIPNSWNWYFVGGEPQTSNEQNPVISYETPGSYPVTLIVANENDTSTVIRTDYIVVIDVPDAPAVPTGDVEVCINDTLSTQFGIGDLPNENYYVWKLEPEEAGEITPSGTAFASIVEWAEGWSGTAYVSVALVNDCGEGDFSENLEVIVHDCSLGINDITNEEITIFPNPNQGSFNISFKENPAKKTTVDVFNVLGEKVNFRKNQTGEKEITLTIEEQGIYLLIIKNGEEKVMKKIVVQ